jgi:UDP-N-acetylmuramyl pentapeptide phosphotransferase/UDP-N-acetylglucosamine-1-phosphate transferase
VASIRQRRYGAPVQALPFLVALAVAFFLAPAARASLQEGGFVRPNYRGEMLPFPFGFIIVAAAVIAFVPLALLERFTDADVFASEIGVVLVYTLGVAFLGLADDALSGPSRGWRGHGAAVLGGAFSTGALKAVGALGLALFVALALPGGSGEYLLSVAVLILATNLFNLFDLRPGRSAKAFVLLGLGLTIGTWDLDVFQALGLFAGPVLVAAFYDVRELAMLGDTGSNLIGALAGLWLVLALGTTGELVALVVLAAVTAYGEFRSISAFVERTPGLRHLDSLGRVHRA